MVDQVLPPHDGQRNLSIEDELKTSYLTYAMSVLVDRALPDIRDGLKPVHRRILFSMRDLNLNPGAKYQKSAKIVGQCIGNYHPHGDTAVYDAMVRMAQDFSLRYMLVDGQGNFGSIDGDSAAAYRYTEARMAKAAGEMLADIQFDTVDFKPSFDGSRQEPCILPSRIPNLLINGSSGIAVGMATNIPPHNLSEVCQALLHVLDHPAATTDELMRFIPAPDFPTGGLICGRGGIKEAYETGKGRVIMRAKITPGVERGKECLIVTEIPYAIKLSTIIESIIRATENEQVDGVSDVRGGTVKEGIRLVIELKRGVEPEVVLNQLWKHTNLEYSFGINMIALDGGRPRTVGLKRLLTAWIDHRLEVIIRRTRFLLARDEARLHIVEGLLKAIDYIDAIVALIRAAGSTEEAKQGLMETFGFSDRQAHAILEMQLRRLTGLERGKLEDEAKELHARIEDYRAILASPERQRQCIREDIQQILADFGDARRSVIVGDASDLEDEDLIADEPCVITITRSGYIKRLPVGTYRTQKRGGKGVMGGALKDDEDQVEQIFHTTLHQYLLVFTTAGRLHWLKAHRIPEASRTSRGRALVNVLEMPEGERVTTTICVRDFPEDRYIVLVTKRGTIKKTQLSAFSNVRQAGIFAIDLDEGDTLAGAVITDGNAELIIATTDGQACRFAESDVRPMGRQAGGVRGIDLEEGAEVVSLAVCEAGKQLLTVCQNGCGKRTPWDEYRLTRRGGKGVININVDRNGPVVASLMVCENTDLLLISRSGKVVRTRAVEISSLGRAAGGVKLIGLDDGDILVGATLLAAEEDEGEEGALTANSETPTE